MMQAGDYLMVTQIEHITIALPQEMATDIKQAVTSGDYGSPSDVICDAVRNWQHKRQAQQQEMENIRAAVERSEADYEAGRIKPAEEVFARLERKYRNMQ
jgi:antitoxin ParD1/3/4